MTVLLALAAACSGGSDLGAKFDVPAPTARSTARQSQPPRTVAVGKLRPPAVARMFAGTASQAGQLTRYCKNATCEESSPRTPPFLSAPVGAFVLFTLGESPVQARTEVRTGPSDRSPALVKLEPGSLMVFNHGLVEGRYLVDLLVTWRTSEARWRFGISVRK
jgi:hypothetical protein